MAREPRSGNERNRIAKQEKRLIVLCLFVSAVMLLSLSRYLFE
ncbi:hypothetical protein [Paenibacillus artemisiicola]|nr:hypothetical protein [Paenibacillus artemisiicola]